MIGTFEMITEHGTGDPKMLSGGISEALITTQPWFGGGHPDGLAWQCPQHLEQPHPEPT